MGLVTMPARRLIARLVATGVCLLAGVQSVAAAPRNVLILSEGPVLPYGLVLRERLISTLQHHSEEPLNVYEELIDRIRFDSVAYDRQRFGVDEAQLPTGSPVVNRELSLWEAHKRTVLVAAAALLGQFLLIGGLLLQRRRRRHAEIALHDLSGRLLSAQEDERRRIARELHDNLSQQMAVLANGIDELSMTPGVSPATLAHAMQGLRQRTTEISIEIHNLSHRLHSTKLEMLGLVAALRGHCKELLAQGVHARFHAENVPSSLPQDVALSLFRIAQEGLNNVVKHSGVREAHVSLYVKGNVLVLSVTDAGRGFDETGAAIQDGLGLASMRERLRLIDGDFSIRSQPGEGTTIVARVPLSTVGARPAAKIAGVA